MFFVKFIVLFCNHLVKFVIIFGDQLMKFTIYLCDPSKNSATVCAIALKFLQFFTIIWWISRFLSPFKFHLMIFLFFLDYFMNIKLFPPRPIWLISLFCFNVIWQISRFFFSPRDHMTYFMICFPQKFAKLFFFHKIISQISWSSPKTIWCIFSAKLFYDFPLRSFGAFHDFFS